MTPFNELNPDLFLSDCVNTYYNINAGLTYFSLSNFNFRKSCAAVLRLHLQFSTTGMINNYYKDFVNRMWQIKVITQST